MSLSSRPLLLFILESDPRKSARPAEAIRVAAGIVVWKKVDVVVYLHDEALRALDEWTDELKDGDNYARYLPILFSAGRPIYLEDCSAHWLALGPCPERYLPIDTPELAALAARATAVLRF